MSIGSPAPEHIRPMCAQLLEQSFVIVPEDELPESTTYHPTCAVGRGFLLVTYLS